MTVLVGLLCRDGVVIGSDSSTTFSAARQFRTIEQKALKTFVVTPDVLLAGTGSVGYMQRFHAVLAGLRGKTADWGKRTHIEAGKTVAQEMLKDFGFTKAPLGHFGALVAFHVAGSYQLCEFATDDFQPEFKSATNWFVAMGSGQPIVDPFFGLLSRALFKGQQPGLKEGVFAALWALTHAIDLNTGGIGGPPQIGTLSSGKRGYEAKLLSPDELAEHQLHVDAAEDHLASYCQKLNPATAPADRPPEPPAPLG